MFGNLKHLLVPLGEKKENKDDAFGCKIKVVEMLYMATENGKVVKIFDVSYQWSLGALIPKQVVFC